MAFHRNNADSPFSAAKVAHRSRTAAGRVAVPCRCMLALIKLLVPVALLTISLCYSLQQHSPPDLVTTNMERSACQFQAHETESTDSMKKFVLKEGCVSATSDGSIGAASLSPSSSLLQWRTLSFKEVADLWQRSPEFSGMFTESLASLPFEAIFWESAPVTPASVVSEVQLCLQGVTVLRYSAFDQQCSHVNICRSNT